MDSEKQMVPVTITYAKPGARPPVFVAGSFSQPAWEEMEMQHMTRDNGDYVFTRDVEAEDGSEIRYKFRMGSEKGWVIDEGAPSVIDEAGNRSNVMKVKMSESLETRTLEWKAVTGDRTGASVSPLLKAVLEHKERDATPQGSRTPEIANVAAEVADTAAMLDAPTPEPYIPDDVAGRLGIRRLTDTPIAEVARTAAEVADTAAKLDQVPQTELLSDTVDLEDLAPTHAEEVEAATGPPLFTYECAGTEHDVEAVGSADMVTVDDPPNRRPSTDVPADDEIDFNDPDLERFPSDVRSILRTVSQLEDGLEEDPDRFDGVPISPVVGPEHSRFTDAALIDDSLLAQPPSPKMMVPQLEIVAEDTAAEATKKDGAPAIDGKESSFLPLI